MRLKGKVIRTRYWRPGEDYLKAIINGIKPYLKDGDVVVVSEKAISTSLGNIIDESVVKPRLLAKLIATFCMRFLWGRFLGKICKFKEDTIEHLRNYPIREGSAHKQAVLQFSGFLQALKYGSEGGIDLSNMPYSYACLPLENPEEEVGIIHREIKRRIGRDVSVIISDTDSTFSFHNLHFTSHPNPLKGIISLGGGIPFILGRALGLKQRATPLAVEGLKMSVEQALNFAEMAHHFRGHGAGKTVWHMTRRYGVGFSDVTWKMLDGVSHSPIVLIRYRNFSTSNIQRGS